MSATRTEARREQRTTTRSRARVPQRRPAPRHRLLLASVAVLALGLLGVLLLNTVISQGAFRQFRLELDLVKLSETEERLAREVQLAESPLSVERRARALGMVPAGSPLFLRLEDGAILGEPVPAPAPTGKVSFQGAPGIQPTRKPSPSASGSASPSAAAPATPTPTPAATPTPTPAAGASLAPWETEAGPTTGAGPDPSGSAAVPTTTPAAPPSATPSPSPTGTTP